jgi:nucleotide-binding universal stress UspA family protein
VAAIDFSPSSLAAARAALPLLGEGATLHLVHVGPLAGQHDVRAHPIGEAYGQALTGRLERAVAALAAPPTVAVRPVALAGLPVERVLEYAESVGADLVAAGRQGHGFWEHLFVGRVTTGLVRGAHVPVLVTPEPSAAEVDELARRLTGVSEGRSPEEWAAQLDGFARRNRGRPTLLETQDPVRGFQVQEVGHALLGATYDPRDRRVELMLGETGADRPHLTHSIPDVTAVAVASDEAGPDLALRVTHGGGWTLLSFRPPAPG